MPLSKRYAQTVVVLTFVVFTAFFHSISMRDSWRGSPQRIGLGKTPGLSPPPASGRIGDSSYIEETQGPEPYSAQSIFHPGNVKAPGSNYSHVVVVPRMQEDDIGWMKKELSDIEFIVYAADDPKALLHPPKNKGHEVMIYLTYIIDHYSNLPDIVLFMHAHRWTHHNNELLGFDAVQMIPAVSFERVTREGYMNLRCQWDPGCPEWLFPGNPEETLKKQEEPYVAKAWEEIHPFDPVPHVLAQPCCAQFAVSKERIRSIPLQRFVFYRDWMLRTPLSDYVSGRIWEYTWQFVFTGQTTLCPAEHVCYCDGFGVCFGGQAQYNEYFELQRKKRESHKELDKWLSKMAAIEEAQIRYGAERAASLEVPERGRDVYLKDRIAALERELEKRVIDAKERGRNPQARAEEAGREWKDGDGF
ncbi:Protein of unknown function DUF3431 [Lasallia pustulata]|uniref:Uncharacterized protein n=1 Tax=Lasallia pustulata TaxID=136370 RepID=A0A1W5CUJ7_9LECA|nr:Protein of unknown function DUF3431 [Lasallia pustulata]